MIIWFITGISRGLGLALARAVPAAGDKVVGTVRSEVPELVASEDALHIIRADLSNRDEAVRATHEAFAAFGHVDVLVNNAGYGWLGAFELVSDVELQRLLGVDVFAPIVICRTALAYLRAQGTGHIINITSIAGRAPGPAAAGYAAAKFAMEGFSASLAQEVKHLGIAVTAVAPGQFRTNFLDKTSLHMPGEPATAYDATVGQALAALAQVNHSQLGDPARAAQVLLELANAAEPPLHLLLGSDALARARTKSVEVDREMRAWEAQTVSTDFG